MPSEYVSIGLTGQERDVKQPNQQQKDCVASEIGVVSFLSICGVQCADLEMCSFVQGSCDQAVLIDKAS